MAVSQTYIYNLALSWLGGNLITSPVDDESVEQALCEANYKPCRDAVLEDRDWTFATTRRILSPSTTAPVFGASYQFPLPSGFIRELNVGSDPAFRNSLEWAKEVLCGDTGAQMNVIIADTEILYLRYICQVQDPKLFSPGFVMAVAARLAMEIALPLTNSPEMHQDMTNLYAVKLERAGAMDGMQGINTPIGAKTLIHVR